MDDCSDNCNLKLVSSFKKELEVGSLVVGAYDRSMGLDQGTLRVCVAAVRYAYSCTRERHLSSPTVIIIWRPVSL